MSGDLTQTASPAEFGEAGDYLAKFPRRPLVVPGNHDLPVWNLWERFSTPLHRFRRWIEPDLFPYQESGQVAVLGINTARAHGWYWDWGRGRISASQLVHVRRSFAGRAEPTLCVLAAHHPFLRPAEERRHLVKGPRELMRLLADCGVDLLLAGHFHKVHTDLAATRHPEVPRIVVAQTSTSTSYRYRAEPNAYNWFEYEGGRLRVEIRSWTDSGFSVASEKIYQKSGRNWERGNDGT